MQPTIRLIWAGKCVEKSSSHLHTSPLCCSPCVLVNLQYSTDKSVTCVRFLLFYISIIPVPTVKNVGFVHRKTNSMSLRGGLSGNWSHKLAYWRLRLTSFQVFLFLHDTDRRWTRCYWPNNGISVVMGKSRDTRILWHTSAQETTPRLLQLTSSNKLIFRTAE